MRCLFALLLLTLPTSVVAAGHFATGIKVGEMTDTTAIVWVRLTRNPKPNPTDAPMVTIEKGNKGFPVPVYPDGHDVTTIRHAVPGVAGRVAIRYRGAEGDWTDAETVSVDPEKDFTAQVRLTELTPNTKYTVEALSVGTKPASVITASFKTAPAADQAAKVSFAVSTGQAFTDQDSPDGFRLYNSIAKLDPSFFVHTGDILYYDRLAKTPELANYHWQRTYSRPTNVKFHQQVGSYFMKDDHDTLVNDCWPTMRARQMGTLTFARGVEIFTEQVPMGDKTYRTIRWGKDLQVWFVEGRDFRSANNMPDGPEKTIWGKTQWEWFCKTVEASDATFKVLISPTPVVGPDRKNKRDNHANEGFTFAGNRLRKYLAEQNMLVVCGDRHWQYHSIDPKTKVREYSCGPASDKHAGGWKQSDFRPEMHRFLKVTGGYLFVVCDRDNGTPTLRLQFRSVEGDLNFESVLTPEMLTEKSPEPAP